MLSRFSLLIKLCQNFLRNKKGVAFVEYTLYMPVFITILMFTTDISRYYRISRQISATASAIAAGAAVQTNSITIDINAATNTDVTKYSAINMIDSINIGFIDAIMQSPNQTWKNNTSAIITNVVFTPTVSSCTISCSYNANVAFVFSYNMPSSYIRQCGQLNALGNGATPAANGIPATDFQAGSLIVVELSYQFQPLFQNSMIPSLPIFIQAFARPLNTTTQSATIGGITYTGLNYLIPVDTTGNLLKTSVASNTDNKMVYTYCTGFPS